MSTVNYNLGRVLPVFKGNYNSSTNYLPLDIVYYNGSSYVCKQNSTGNSPTNTTYWQIVAMKGELSPTLLPEQVASIIQTIENDSNFVVDANYVHTDYNFTGTYKDTLDTLPSAIGDATITFQRNGTNIGTFTTNSTTNSTINIQVPTQISDLTGDDTFLKMHKVIQNTTNKYETSYLKPGEIIICTVPLVVLRIQDMIEKNGWYKVQSTIIDFTTTIVDDMTIDLPLDKLWLDVRPPASIKELLENDTHYRFIFDGNVLKIQTLYNIR